MARNMIFLKDMPFMLSVGTDAWQRKGKIQPVHVTVQLDQVSVINEAAFSDDVSKTLDYGKLYKSIQHNLESQKEYDNILQVAEQVLLAITVPGIDVCLQIDLPKATLRAEGGFAYTLNRKTNAETSYDVLRIRGIKCACIIGVNPHERRDKQILIIDLTCRAENNPPAEPTTAISEVSATRIATTQYHKIIETLVHVRQFSILLLLLLSWRISGA
jgi:dihydroneopterin aldolase